MPTRYLTVTILSAAAALTVGDGLAAQVALVPTQAKPAGWERFALRVFNQSDTAITEVRLTVPDAVLILGVDAGEGWSFHLDRGSESAPQVIDWSGGAIPQSGFREFAFFGRLAADVRERDLVFPVRLSRRGAPDQTWSRLSGAAGSPPVVRIVGTTEISAWATFAVASFALGLSVLAVAFGVANRKQSTRGGGGESG